MLAASTRVRACKVAFDPESRPELGIKAKKSIEKGTFIWEVNGILSADFVQEDTISSMEAHRDQRLGKGPRLFAGSARFMNHSCKPNIRASVFVPYYGQRILF